MKRLGSFLANLNRGCFGPRSFSSHSVARSRLTVLTRSTLPLTSRAVPSSERSRVGISDPEDPLAALQKFKVDWVDSVDSISRDAPLPPGGGQKSRARPRHRPAPFPRRDFFLGGEIFRRGWTPPDDVPDRKPSSINASLRVGYSALLERGDLFSGPRGRPKVWSSRLRTGAPATRTFPRYSRNFFWPAVSFAAQKSVAKLGRGGG